MRKNLTNKGANHSISKAASWWHGILARSLIVMLGIALLVGGLMGLLSGRLTGERTQVVAMQKLGELLDTVESTVSIACFANDKELAREVAQGLLRNSEVRRVVIRSGDRELVQIARPGAEGSADDALVTRQVHSPFIESEITGSVQLTIDQPAIDGRVAENIRFSAMLLTLMLLLVVAATLLAMYYLVVRPIKQTSDRMHDLDATQGELLYVPEGHERSEIGRLVDDINHLMGQLGETLKLERDLRQRQEVDQRKYHDLFDNSSAGIFVARGDGQLFSFNRAFVELSWLPQAPGGAGSPRRLTEALWQNPQKLLAMIVVSLDVGGPLEDDYQLDGRRGDTRWLHVAVTPLGDGSVQGMVSDVTQIKREELSARRLAVTDSLTSFANREGLNQTYATLHTRTTPFVLVRIDFDGIRQITEAMGFSTGDRVLLNVASRLRANVDKGDFIARISGTKFALILNAEDDAVALLSRLNALVEHLSQPYPRLDDGRGMPVVLGVRVGAACFPADGVELQPLLRRAELALANVPMGSHSCLLFDPAQEAVAEHRRRMEDDLRAAVAARELEVYCQPIIDLQQGRVVGGEALLRWQHPQHGFISPEVFIPMAEQISLIGELGRWVLEETCRQVAQWRGQGLDLYVSVNVSVRQIPEELPPATVIEIMERHGLPPDAIAIEITESLLMNDVTTAQEWIARLREAGLRIYLDDFGTGYSSLSYLKRFALDTVKIDKSFIRDIQADNSDHALVNAIITMARSLGLNVVAEGIEEHSQLHLLREAGCGYGQGYHFSRPVPMNQFVATLTRINDDLSKAG
ncbi:MAG: bifunctional diguanylate cyclase/phosphodiesterase [Sterolibacterium sp.]|nr:bifunctional diguanylate cyclase/phosphodiesterase [Sterolibacterium sp.]